MTRSAPVDGSAAAAGSGGETGADGATAAPVFGGLLDLEGEQVHGRGCNPATQSIAGFASMYLLFGDSLPRFLRDDTFSR